MTKRCEQSAARLEKGKVRSGGVELSTYADGPVDAPPLLFVNALGMRAATVAPLARSLSQRVRFVTWDARLSPGADGDSATVDTSVDAHLMDLEEVFGACEAAPGRAIVGGWSNGAELAWRFAARRPEQVAALVLVNPYISGALPESDFISKHRDIYQRVNQQPGMANVLAAFMQRNRTDEAAWMAGLHTTDAEVAELVSAPFQSGDALRRHARAIAALSRAPTVNLGSPLSVPIAVLIGGRDRIANPQMGELVAAHQAQAEVWCQPDAGHYIPCSPDVACEAIEGFLDRHLSAGDSPSEMVAAGGGAAG